MPNGSRAGGWVPDTKGVVAGFEGNGSNGPMDPLPWSSPASIVELSSHESDSLGARTAQRCSSAISSRHFVCLTVSLRRYWAVLGPVTARQRKSSSSRGRTTVWPTGRVVKTQPLRGGLAQLRQITSAAGKSAGVGGHDHFPIGTRTGCAPLGAATAPIHISLDAPITSEILVTPWDGSSALRSVDFWRARILAPSLNLVELKSCRHPPLVSDSTRLTLHPAVCPSATNNPRASPLQRSHPPHHCTTGAGALVGAFSPRPDLAARTAPSHKPATCPAAAGHAPPPCLLLTGMSTSSRTARREEDAKQQKRQG